MTLGRVKLNGKVLCLDLINKLSYLSNGKSVTGYHKLRMQHLKSKNELYDEVVLIDYIDVVDMYK